MDLDNIKLKNKILFQVKADVQNVSGELIVSGLDSATSLIQAAKNLMNAVVLTVKASYVASTKYPRQAASAGLNSKPIGKSKKFQISPLSGRAPVLKNNPLDLLIRGLDNFATMESYFGGLKSLCDNFHCMTLNIC